MKEFVVGDVVVYESKHYKLVGKGSKMCLSGLDKLIFVGVIYFRNLSFIRNR